MHQNPYLWILKADPAKYIRTGSSTLAVFLKVAEGFFAAWLARPVFTWLRELLPPFFRGSIPPLPYALQHLDRFVPFVGNKPERIIMSALLLLIFVLLLALCAEGAALLWLRFAISGARLVTLLCRVLWTAIVFLILLIAAFTVNSVYYSGFHPPVLITAGACILPLILLFFYYRDAIQIMAAIDYEIRIGYKETSLNLPTFLKNSFLLALLSLSAAASVYFLNQRGLVRPRRPLLWEIGFAVMAVKYYSIYSACRTFRRCHR